jgi:hypothetical protein
MPGFKLSSADNSRFTDFILKYPAGRNDSPYFPIQTLPCPAIKDIGITV